MKKKRGRACDTPSNTPTTTPFDEKSWFEKSYLQTSEEAKEYKSIASTFNSQLQGGHVIF